MMAGGFEEVVRGIREDDTSGAVELVRRAAEGLSGVGTGELEEACRLVVEAQPAMAPMVNLAEAVRAGVAGGRTVAKVCAEFVKQLEVAGRKVAENAAKLFQPGMTVLTHSSSRTVFDALVLAQERVGGIQVICTESRPVCEGVALARELEEVGVAAKVVADASMFRVMDQVDLAVCGADSVSEAGVVNKTGTALLALAARELDRPLYALCGSQKFLPVGYPPPGGAGAPAGDPEHEAYFEVTPLDLFAGVVTEDWIVGPPELADMISRRSR